MKKINTDLIAKFILLFTIPIILFFILEYFLALIGIPTLDKLLVIEDDWRQHHMYSDINFIADDDLLWKGNPQTPNFNKQGFHCRELTEEKPSGVIKVFCLGDSNTLGNFRYDYPNLLELQLNRALNDSISYEVYNLGIYGYSSFQGLIVMEKVIKYKPDIVIINFGWNDAVPVRTSDKELIKVYKRTNPNIKRFLLNSRIYSVIFNVLIHESGGRKDTVRVSTEDFKSNYEKIISLSEENNIRIIIFSRAVHPGIKKNEDNWRFDIYKYNQIAQEVASTHKVEYIDLNMLINSPKDFIDESHYTKDAYNKLATILSEQIINE